MEVNRSRTLALEIFKTINDISPNYMKNYGNKKFSVLGPTIWNQLPKKIKSETYFSKCKRYIDTRFALKCKCNIYALT